MPVSRRHRRGSQAIVPEAFYSERQRREAFLAAGLASVIRLALGVALIVCAVQSYLVFRAPLGGIAPEARWILPAVLSIAAAFALSTGARDLRRALQIRSATIEASAGDE